jgi:hypothetical protein
MEFLTFGYKISLILSKKLMGFKVIAIFCELVNWLILKAIFFSKTVFIV